MVYASIAAGLDSSGVAGVTTNGQDNFCICFICCASVSSNLSLTACISICVVSGRRQRFVINGMISDWAKIFAGVPRGSILGPLLFLIYINNIVNNIQSNIHLFADDTSLYIFVENPHTAALTLNSDLGAIHHWTDDWLVDLKPYLF